MAKDILLCDDPSLVQVSSSTERSMHDLMVFKQLVDLMTQMAKV
jgi:hypothetical protein